MKYFRGLFVAISISLMLFVFSGCEDHVLNRKPTTTFSEKDMWNDIELIKKYVWDSYSHINWRLKKSGYSPTYVDASSDHLYSSSVYAKGTIGPEDMGAFSGIWGDRYDGIKNVNDFFKKVKTFKGKSSELKQLKGEMMFIRAYNYADLIKLFGGVPIIKKAFDLQDDFKVKRSSYQECVEFIASQLNEIIENNMVPENLSDSQWGRINLGTVRALKSEVLLYAASKLHSPDESPNGPLYDYKKADKWKEASKAAKAIIDMNQYSLVQNVDNAKDYQDIFLEKTSEMIFAKQTSKKYQNSTVSEIDRYASPNGFPRGFSNYAPTQNIINDFQMKNGKSIKESPLYDPSSSSIYQNRELRFYADIVYNGSEYRGRTIEFYLPGGEDSREGVSGIANSTKTGYTSRKYMDESYRWWKTSDYAGTPKMIFRLAEIYLNYAEAEYHLGHYNIAIEYVNKIRNRVNLPDIHSSGSQLLKDIRHERNIELAFEGNHFYDALRWMTAEKRFGEDSKGIQWKYVDKDGNLTPPQNSVKLTYEIYTAQEQDFPKRQYYIPIPATEIRRANLKQNVGY